MRELARVAASRNLTQEHLARNYAELPGTAVNGGNVSRHFASKAPQRKTIEPYRKILYVSREHLRLINGSPLSTIEMRRWRAHLISMLELRLKSKADREAVIATTDALPDRDRGAALHGRLPLGLNALWPYVAHAVDLTAGVRRRSQKADFWPQSGFEVVPWI